MSAAITPPRGRLFRFREACAYLGGMTEPRLRTLVARRKIPFHHDGRLGFWQVDLDQWMVDCRTASSAGPKSKIALLDAKPERPHVEPDLSALLPPPSRRKFSGGHAHA